MLSEVEAMTFGSKLKALRQEYELTQNELAKKLDTSKSNISKYESDTIEPNMKTLVLISNCFNVSIDYLLGTSKSKETVHLPSASDKVLLNYFHKVQNSLSISEKEKSFITEFFPYAVVLQQEEQELLEYYSELSIKDRRWIMGQMIDLIKKANEKQTKLPKAQ